MRYKEFINATARKIVHAHRAGSYNVDRIDTSKLLTEDEAIHATAFLMLHNETPNIEKVGDVGYRVSI
jgi:hypothetical protein